LSKYRRIEVNAYHRKVTVVSGEWRPGDVFEAQSVQTEEGVSLENADSCEPVAPHSPEGQLILLETVRSLEQRLSPEARALIAAGRGNRAPVSTSNLKQFWSRLRSLFKRNDPHSSLDVKSAVKQSVED
jgi:hypothetical protein